MSFVSIAFLLLYPVALLLRVAFARDARGDGYFAGLLAISLVFYGWHFPSYLALILASTLTDYFAGRALANLPHEREGARRAVVAASIALNLGLLGYFKYAGFLAELVADVLAAVGVSSGGFSTLEIVLPIGISFYTFQSMSYTIDVYRGHTRAEPNFVRFGLFVAFFPQLVAGPIVRAGDFSRQLLRRRRLSAAVWLQGVRLLVRGLFLKLVVADNLGKIVDTHWAAVSQGDAPPALAASVIVFFSCQLLCDFAGYCDIARGLAYPLGFRLPINFNAPFIATSFRELWRRWHITLSEWMRDYLYTPLGGNRRGRGRTLANLFIVMVVSGLWHGAASTFVLWGCVHGIAIVVERALRPTDFSGAARAAWFVVVQLTWIGSMSIFRAADAEQAWTVLANVGAGLVQPASFVTIGDAKIAADLITGWFFTLPVWLMHLHAVFDERATSQRPPHIAHAAYAGVMLAMLASFYARPDGFIYFQF